MRTISFVDRLALDFNGNVGQNALCLGDADNDNENEIIVGNSYGELAIFKGSSSKPWKTSQDLGHITAISVGDLLNLGRNVVTVVSADGYLFIFDFENMEELLTSGGDGTGVSASNRRRIKPSYKQRIPANVKQVLIEDVDGDGFTELLVALTDRVIRTYRWHHAGDLYSQRLNGHLTPCNKWEFVSQIGSVTLNRNADGSPVLLVSQPGGDFLKLNCAESPHEDVLSKISVEYESLLTNSLRNPNVSAEILGSFKSDEIDKNSPFAIATLDGTILFVQDEKIKHRFKINRQLFCLNKLDICGDGKDELIVSSWDGPTYIISQDNQRLEFIFDETISTFKAGYFSIDGETVPVLVYVTFSNIIYVYYNITLTKGMLMKNLLNEESFQFDEAVQKFKEDSLKMKSSEKNNIKVMSELNTFLLYDYPSI